MARQRSRKGPDRRRRRRAWPLVALERALPDATDARGGKDGTPSVGQKLSRDLRWFSSSYWTHRARSLTHLHRPPSRRRARANLVRSTAVPAFRFNPPQASDDLSQSCSAALFLPRRAPRELAAPRRAHFDKERSVNSDRNCPPPFPMPNIRAPISRCRRPNALNVNSQRPMPQRAYNVHTCL